MDTACSGSSAPGKLLAGRSVVWWGGPHLGAVDDGVDAAALGHREPDLGVLVELDAVEVGLELRQLRVPLLLHE